MTCLECGKEMPAQSGRGRRRLRCKECLPARARAYQREQYKARKEREKAQDAAYAREEIGGQA